MAAGSIVSTGFIKSKTLETKALTVGNMSWVTDLELSPGEKLVKSPLYITFDNTNMESKWQFEIDPNFVDEEGTRFISFWVRLLELHPAQEKLYCFIRVHMAPEPIIPEEMPHIFTKQIGLDYFSRDVPCYGIKEFIPYYGISGVSKEQRLEFFVHLCILVDPSGPLSNVPLHQAFKSFHLAEEQMSDNLVLDGAIHVGRHRTKCDVDRKRMSLYSPVLRKYFSYCIEFDATKIISNKKVALLVIDYCHSGGLLPSFPKKLKHVTQILIAAKELEIEGLRKACQDRLLKELCVENFAGCASHCMAGLLDQSARPIIYNFFTRNIQELEKNEAFVKTYKTKDFKEFLNSLVFDDAEDTGSATENDSQGSVEMKATEDADDAADDGYDEDDEDDD